MTAQTASQNNIEAPDVLNNPYVDIDSIERPDTQMLQARIGMEDYYTMFKLILPRRGTQDNLVATFLKIFTEAAKLNPLIHQHYDRTNESSVRTMLERLYIDPSTGIDCRTGRKFEPSSTTGTGTGNSKVVSGCTDIDSDRDASSPNDRGATSSTHSRVPDTDVESTDSKRKVRKGK